MFIQICYNIYTKCLNMLQNFYVFYHSDTINTPHGLRSRKTIYNYISYMNLTEMCENSAFNKLKNKNQLKISFFF